MKAATSGTAGPHSPKWSRRVGTLLAWPASPVGRACTRAGCGAQSRWAADPDPQPQDLFLRKSTRRVAPQTSPGQTQDAPPPLALPPRSLWGPGSQACSSHLGLQPQPGRRAAVHVRRPQGRLSSPGFEAHARAERPEVPPARPTPPDPEGRRALQCHSSAPTGEAGRVWPWAQR